MEPGLAAVPSTLLTLRQHLHNVPQVGPREAPEMGWPAFPSGRGLAGGEEALKVKFRMAKPQKQPG